MNPVASWSENETLYFLKNDLEGLSRMVFSNDIDVLISGLENCWFDIKLFFTKLSAIMLL